MIRVLLRLTSVVRRGRVFARISTTSLRVIDAHGVILHRALFFFSSSRHFLAKARGLREAPRARNHIFSRRSAASCGNFFLSLGDFRAFCRLDYRTVAAVPRHMAINRIGSVYPAECSFPFHNSECHCILFSFSSSFYGYPSLKAGPLFLISTPSFY